MNPFQLFFALILCLSFPLKGAETLSYEVQGKTYQGYWTKVSDKAPTVLLLHDWDGLTDYEVKRANMLTELGYNVFAADLFGAGIRPTKLEDKRQHTGELYKDRDKLRALIQGSLDKAVSLGANANRVVVMGYCFGGAAVLEAARAGVNALGFVLFHGGLSTPDGQNYQNVKAPILVLHGSADDMIPMSQFAELATRLENDGVKHEMISYSGAPHAFTVFGSDRYRSDADNKSWQRFTQFLLEQTKNLTF